MGVAVRKNMGKNAVREFMGNLMGISFVSFTITKLLEWRKNLKVTN